MHAIPEVLIKLQIKHLVALVRGSYDGLGSFRMRVGNKQLPEGFVVDHLDNLLDTAFVELVKNIIKKEDRIFATLFFHEFKLGQFQGDQEGFLLALGTEFF